MPNKNTKSTAIPKETPKKPEQNPKSTKQTNQKESNNKIIYADGAVRRKPNTQRTIFADKKAQ